MVILYSVKYFVMDNICIVIIVSKYCHSYEKPFIFSFSIEGSLVLSLVPDIDEI